MSDFKVIKDLKIGAEIYDELYNRIIEEEVEEMDEYDYDDFDNFIEEYGNSENSLYLLSEGEGYYIDGVVNEWDDIINTLYLCNQLDNIEPRDMTKRKITDLFLNQVCSDVIHDYVAELNSDDSDDSDEGDDSDNELNNNICLRCGVHKSKRDTTGHDCFYGWDCLLGSLWKLQNKDSKIDNTDQDKIIAFENENKKLKEILHKLLELGDDIAIGNFEGEEIRTIENLEKINLKLKGTVLYTIKEKNKTAK
tara:strand:- start:292 stop:1044 length:753 start_codon:yes stop_codon:yes gene_type:complete